VFNKSLTEHRNADTLKKLNDTEKIIKERKEQAYINMDLSNEEKVGRGAAFGRAATGAASFLSWKEILAGMLSHGLHTALLAHTRTRVHARTHMRAQSLVDMLSHGSHTALLAVVPKGSNRVLPRFYRASLALYHGWSTRCSASVPLMPHPCNGAC